MTAERAAESKSVTNEGETSLAQMNFWPQWEEMLCTFALQDSSHWSHVAAEHLKCDWSELRSVVFSPDFKDFKSIKTKEGTMPPH